MTEVKLESGLCCETRYVSYGRTGETFPCDKQAKTTTIASGGGRSMIPREEPRKGGFRAIYLYRNGPAWEKGDTLHVCAVHDRMHRKRIEKEEASSSHDRRSKENLAAVEDFIKKYELGNDARPYYHVPYKGQAGYTREVTVSLEALEEMIDGVYSRGTANGFKLADRQAEREKK